MSLIKSIEYKNPLEYFQRYADEPGAVLLHSAKQMDGLGRYSYFAMDPFLTLNTGGNIFDNLEVQLNQFQVETIADLPPFQGGAIGFLSYELLQQLENVPAAKVNDMQFPLAMIGFYDVVVSFDHQLKKAWIISTGFPEIDPVKQTERAKRRADEMLSKIKLAEPIDYGTEKIFIGEIKTNFSFDQYLATIEKTIEYIFAGDIFEANIAQRFEAELPDDFTPWQLFARSCKINAATFASYINFGDTVLVSASPERFIKCEAGKVECRPIKGTRPRSDDPTEDKILADDLLNSKKDWAENIMIVDLMRNDIARVCIDNSVEATQLCGLESYATVHHLVSVVQGQLQNDKNAVDLLKATFPGGSITGAPKIRAMEIIAELEPHHRGPYCGNILCIGFDGFMDSSITIRTFAIHKNKLSFHAGGAIVADSDPAQEYQESLDKAQALVRALTEVP